MKVVSFIMLYAPIGLAAYFAALVGKFGPQLLGTYFRAAIVYYPASIIYFLLRLRSMRILQDANKVYKYFGEIWSLLQLHHWQPVVALQVFQQI